MDNRLKRSQDYDLGLRMFQKGFPLHRKAILLANHHMVQYVVRDDYVVNSKYTALLLRKHWNNGNYLCIFIKQNYTAVVLLMALVLSYLYPWILLLYLCAVLYKNIKQKNTWRYYWRPIGRDIVLIASILTYYPSYPTLNYRQV